MSLHRRSRWSARTVRRSLLVASAVGVIVLAACSPAWADGEVWATSPAAPAPAAAPVAVPVAAPVAVPAPDSGAQLGYAPNTVPYAYARHAPSKRRWYGWETLMADGISVLVVPALAVSIDSKGDGGAAVAAAAGSYVLAAPIIHLAHGRPGIAAASLGLRLGAPVGGAFLGAAAAGNCNGSFCRLEGAAIGFVLGMVTATVVDAAALSYEPRDKDEDGGDERSRDEARRAEPSKAPPKKAISFAPTGGPRREGGFDVGLAATF
jgi:hypothetical protein